MLWRYIFWLLFVGAIIFVIRKGSRPHRQAIGIMIFGVIATTLIFILGSHKWLPLNIAVMTIDIIALLLFGMIAHQSKEFWPLLLTGWQLATVLIHIASLFAKDLLPHAYGVGQGIWANLQFVTIVVATIRQQRVTVNSLNSS